MQRAPRLGFLSFCAGAFCLCSMKNVLYLLVVVCCIVARLSTGFAHAQDISVRAILETATIKVGEQTTLRLSVEHPNTIQIDFPFALDSLGERVEIVDRTAIDSSALENGRSLQRQTFVLTSFEDGSYTIPALKFVYYLPGSSEQRVVLTEPLLLTVTPVVVDEGALQQMFRRALELRLFGKSSIEHNIRDIKPIIPIPQSLSEFLPHLLVGSAILLLIAAIAWFVWWRRRRQSALTEEFVAPPARAAFEIAMEELERLQAERLWQNGETERFYIRLSDIIRTYLESHFGLKAIESVTDEILADYRSCRPSPASVSALNAVLKTSDMVKFARYEASAAENEQMFRLAVEFVQITATQAQEIEESLED